MLKYTALLALALVAPPSLICGLSPIHKLNDKIQVSVSVSVNLPHHNNNPHIAPQWLHEKPTHHSNPTAAINSADTEFDDADESDAPSESPSESPSDSSNPAPSGSDDGTVTTTPNGNGNGQMKTWSKHLTSPVFTGDQASIQQQIAAWKAKAKAQLQEEANQWKERMKSMMSKFSTQFSSNEAEVDDAEIEPSSGSTPAETPSEPQSDPAPVAVNPPVEDIPIPPTPPTSGQETTEVTHNPDGSTITTVHHPDGSITVTTKKSSSWSSTSFSNAHLTSDSFGRDNLESSMKSFLDRAKDHMAKFEEKFADESKQLKEKVKNIIDDFLQDKKPEAELDDAEMNEAEEEGKSETVKNPDGSTTTTVHNADGSITTTTVHGSYWTSSTSSPTFTTDSNGQTNIAEQLKSWMERAKKQMQEKGKALTEQMNAKMEEAMKSATTSS